jgi:beta-barrel assembly-enhancing protease
MAMKRTIGAPSAVLAGALVLCVPFVALAETKPATPGFNLFSVEQDVEIGRQSAAEAERQLPMLKNRNADRYLGKIVSRLAAQAPGAKYPYTIKAVNDPTINAFALPGGPMYVNRGLFEAARSEAELAGVLAHEMAHVALRHGTHQASKAYLGQAGLGILGGLLGKNGGNTAQIVNAVGGLGLNAVFLKFGRDAEYQADQVGAQIMAAAGYNPVAMADFFELLRREQGRDPGKLEQFLSDHPSSGDREARIRTQAAGLRLARSQDVGGFDRMRADLRRLAPASPAVAQRLSEPRNPDVREQASGRYDVRVASPSSRFQRFEQRNGLFTIEHPDNWRAYAADSGYAVSMAPDGGVVDTGNGQQAMLYGVIVNHYAPFEGDTDRRLESQQRNYAPFEDSDRWRGSLADATDDLVRQIIRSNSYLQAQEGQARREQIDGQSSFSVALAGRSPVTGQEERVTVVTRGLSDGNVIYALCVGPGSGYDGMARTFTQMLRTLNVNDDAIRRGALTSSGSGSPW